MRTAPAGRVPFRFTSFGDLATPNTAWVLSYGQSAYAVKAVESFKPLFHLLNGDLCYADLNPTVQPEVWRDFGNNNQASAAFRPWMPCPGNHEIEFDNGPQGYTSYLTRYLLPDNGVPRFQGHWYSFQVGSALFVSLDADDVVYQDAGPLVSGPAALTPAASTGNPAIAPGTSLYVRGYSGGAQTAWLRRTLAAARADRSVDWIIVQMHQDSCSSSATGNGSDLGIREEWLPLFDEYQVDLVLCGHDHDYERSFPVRGYDSMVGTEVATGAPVQTRRPHPVTTTHGHHVRHVLRHRAPDPGRRRHERPAGRLRSGHRGRPAPGQGVHEGQPARSRDGRRDLGSGPRRTRSRTPPGRRCATRPPATGSRSSTWTRASRGARPRSRSPTTTRWEPTRRTPAPARPAPRTRTTRPLKRSRSSAPAQTATGTAGRPRPPGPPVTLGKATLPTTARVCPGGRRRPIGSDPEKQAHRWVQTSAQS